MPFLLNEDAALKAKFTGLTVADATQATRPVSVRFLMPETELGNVTFPMVIVTPPSISVAHDREHRGPLRLPYVPEQEQTKHFQVIDPQTGDTVSWYPPVEDSDVTLSPIHLPDYPIPYNLDYEVRVYARKESHITQLVGSLAQIDRIPNRFGYVTVPQTGTVQTLDVLGGPEITATKDRDDKRIFVALYSVRVVSELNLYDYTVVDASDLIQTVDLILHTIPDSFD